MKMTKKERREERRASVVSRLASQGLKTTDRRLMLYSALEMVGANPTKDGEKTIEYDEFDSNHQRIHGNRVKITGKMSPSRITGLACQVLDAYDKYGTIKKPGDIDELQIELCAARMLQHAMGEGWQTKIGRHIEDNMKAAIKNPDARTKLAKPRYRQIDGEIRVRINDRIVTVNAPIGENIWFKNSQITMSRKSLPEALLSGLAGRKINDLLDKPVMGDAFAGYIVDNAETVINPSPADNPGTSIIRLQSQMIDINDDIITKIEEEQ